MSFVEYLLIAMIIFGKFAIGVDLVIGLLAVCVGAILVGEAAFAWRPSPERLATADRLILVGVIGQLAILVGGSLVGSAVQ